MATYDGLLTLDNKLKISQRHLQFLAIENKLKRKMYGEKHPIFIEKWVFTLNFRRKHSKI